jgi:hypothetical protein
MKFRFYRDVEAAGGIQSFTIEADSIEEAKLKWEGNSDLECDESEVTSLGEPHGWHEAD